jgi:hypothetical protein
MSEPNGCAPAPRYQVDPVVSCGEEEDGAILYNPDEDDTAVVNLTGRALWAYLEAPHTVNEMADYLVQSYRRVAIEQATEDATAFVRALVPGFLREVDGHA